MTKYILLDLDQLQRVNQFTVIGSRLGYSTIEISSIDYNIHINSIKHLVLEKDEAIKGNKYWGEVRDKQSSYEIVDNLTVKTKIAVSNEALQVAVGFMKKVGQFALTNIIDMRYNIIQSKYSSFEVFTWNMQIEEATKYILDSTTAVPLLSSLANSRNISVLELANKVIKKSTAYRNEISSLLITQQTVSKKLLECSTIREVNKFYEEYFGIEMPQQQAYEEELTDETGKRTHPVEYGIKF